MVSEQEKEDLIGMDISDAENIYSDITITVLVKDGTITQAGASPVTGDVIPVETQSNIITRILD